MPHYETVLILRQDLSNSQAESIASKTQQDLKAAKATIDRAESWGLRTLAYPIRKNRKGHYFIINHSNTSETTQEMQRVLTLNEDLLRLLTVKTAQPQTQPTPIAAAQAHREQETTSPNPTRTGERRTNEHRTNEHRTNQNSPNLAPRKTSSTDDEQENKAEDKSQNKDSETSDTPEKS